MRRMTLLLALLSLGFAHGLKAQITDVYAGNDTIELRLGNYQYGFIQWQVSQDTVHWENIEGATDTVYRFLPSKNAYYRALASFENCPKVTSRVCYVQVPPKADAGPDRKLSIGSGATMLASMGEDCIGRWEIIEGANGVLDDPNSPNSYFEGTDNEYKLKWTVTNACGSDSDTIAISYRHTVFNENYIVVDTTDVLLSDSTQLVNGEYLIAFSEPVALNDSMLLCGMGEQGFLRRIVSYTYDSELDVYDIETEQASVEDFLIDGVLSFDLNAMMRRGKVVFGRRYPTRKDIAELGLDGLYFRLPDSSDTTAAWNLGQKGWKMNWIAGPVSLPGYLIVVPDLDVDLPDIIFEIEKEFFDVTYLKCGMQFDYHYGLRLTIPESTGYTMFKEDFPLFGPIEFPPLYWGPLTFHGKWDVTLDYNASCVLDTDMTLELSSDGNFIYYILFDPSAPQQWTTHHSMNSSPMEFKMIAKPLEYANISFKASVGTGISLLVYNFVGPYAKLALVAEEKFNILGEGFNAGEFRLGLDFVGGIKAQYKKKKFFDFKFTLPLLTFLQYKDPASINVFSGNYQSFLPDNHLPEPIAVQVLNSRGKPSEATLVKFETDDGYFTNAKVYTNSNGIASTNWICGDNPTGVVMARAYTYDVKHEPIGGGPVLFRAYHGNASVPSDCLHSTLAVTADVSSGLLAPKITGGFTPYRYSISGSTIPGSSVVPVLPQTGATYHISVWDAFDCHAECYYTHPTFDCFSSNLQLRVEQHENTVTAYATGGAGGGGDSWKESDATDDAVYEFCIDDGAFSPNNVFSNLMDGRHVVYVRDANGCQESQVITVDTNGSGIGTGGGDDDGVTVTTSAVNVVDNTSATCGGSVSIFGNAFVTQYGVCWSTHHAPTTSDEYVQKAYSGTSFSNCLMTNLLPNVVYYVRAFAVTNTGTVYGNEVGFSTTAVAPVVTCGGVGNTTSSSVRALGNVSNTNGVTVTERGFCWSRSHNPTVSGSHLACGSGTSVYFGNITGLEPDTPYYLRAYATNSVGTSYSEEVSFRTYEGGSTGNHDYVDLGLPSGTLWATCNVGANTPEEYGDYFAWGETQTKEVYDWSTYQYCMGSENTLTKYCDNADYGYNGFTDNLTILLPEDDAATANWGDGWRVPTKEEWEELKNNTTSTLTNQNGVHGELFTASNGNSLFLPAAGCRSGSYLYCVGGYCNYWSSSLRSLSDYPFANPSCAWEFYFGNAYCNVYNYYDRFYGRSVRAVRSARQN